MHPPREWLVKIAYENPRATAFILAFGATVVSFAIGLLVADCRAGL